MFDLDGKARAEIAVSLEALTATGAALWRALSVTNASGDYIFEYKHATGTTPAQFRIELARQRVQVGSNRFYTSHKWVQVFTSQWPAEGGGPGTRRMDIRLRFDHAPPLFTMLLMLPALFGLLMAGVFGAILVHRRQAATTSDADASATWRFRAIEPSKRVLSYYVLAGCSAWIIVLFFFAFHFVRSDLQSIYLFSADMQVPVLIPMAAFLGVLVFATSRLLELAKRGLEDDEREAIFIDLGNRVFIAPYVATVAVLIVFSDRSGAPPALLAFATGLWIEPVLVAIRALGDKLLVVGGTTGAVTTTTVPPPTSAPLSDTPAAQAPVPVVIAAQIDGANGQRSLRVTGSGFRDSTAVSVDGQRLTPTSRTPKEIVAPLGVLAPTATSRVEVTTPPPGGGTSSVVISVAGATNA